MIRFTRGNLLEAPVEALVNTVNEIGVMGKGIALMFRDAFPHNSQEYTRAAKSKRIRVGKMFVTENPDYSGPRWIINFPTKKHWRHPSRLQWIASGLEDLVSVIKSLNIRSIALPPLGCGNGGLEWSEVRTAIESALAQLESVDIVVYEPTERYQGKAKVAGVEKLTPARALITELVRRYGALGLDCTILEVQKLAWFLSQELTRLGVPDPLRLEFKADRYGPYDDKLRHLLNALDGSFLHSEKRIADSAPSGLIWFDQSRLPELQSYLKSPAMRRYIRALEQTSELIDGFESPFGMELLATIDWLLVREHLSPQVSAIRDGLMHWPAGKSASIRKFRMFNERAVDLALQRITDNTRRRGNATFFDSV